MRVVSRHTQLPVTRPPAQVLLCTLTLFFAAFYGNLLRPVGALNLLLMCTAFASFFRVLYRNYEVDDELRGNNKTGWALVLTIKDLSQVLDAPASASATRLWEVWGEHFSDLGQEDDDVDSYKEILNALEAVRADVHALLRSLD